MIENTTYTTHFILPHMPSDELDDDMLKVVCGGSEPVLGNRIHYPYRLTPIPGQ